ncbi:MAG: histidine--tRNA ligase [Lutibacter sp.]|jgi:histidyl-tRNA synthetase
MGKRLSIPSGTADVFGARARRRQHVLEIIRRVYEMFGFEPLFTPTLEHAIVFHGHHGEGEKLLFNLRDKNDVPLVLRYDLTVPLARVVNMYPNIPRPFKRYQIATSFRDDEVDHGHFREFTQCDGDVIGVSDLSADAEVICMAHLGLKSIGFKSFIIRINHRGIMKGIAEYACGPNYDVLEIQRALDFADKSIKQGIAGVKTDLLRRGIPKSAVEKFIPILNFKGNTFNKLDFIKKELENYPDAQKGITELQIIINLLPEEVQNNISVDLTLARGADYYTGFILEGVIPGIPVGAVLGGGRYDNLISATGGGNEPATGMAFGLERILTVMEEMSIMTDENNQTILAYSSNSGKKDAFLATHHLRNSGIMVDFNPQISVFSEAIEYAKKRNYSAILICGDNRNFSVKPVAENALAIIERIGDELSKIN